MATNCAPSAALHHEKLLTSRDAQGNLEPDLPRYVTYITHLYFYVVHVILGCCDPERRHRDVIRGQLLSRIDPLAPKPT
jgi:hypothetical protein